MSLDPAYRDDAGKALEVRTELLSRSTVTDAASLGAKIGLLSVIPASLAGTSVAVVATGTVTSIHALAGGLVAGAATFCACTGVGVAIGAGVGVVVGTVRAARRRQERERELTMLISRIGV